jgi:hypothetical protein
MSKFHSTVTRRDFMKGLGFGTAGLAVSAPVVHDLDELISSPVNTRRRDWWIKEVDEPTVEIDWSLIHRHHGFHSTQSSALVARYLPGGPDEYRALRANASAQVTEGIKANTPGLTFRDDCLANAARGELRFPAREDSIGSTMMNIKTP